MCGGENGLSIKTAQIPGELGMKGAEVGREPAGRVGVRARPVGGAPRGEDH